MHSFFGPNHAFQCLVVRPRASCFLETFQLAQSVPSPDLKPVYASKPWENSNAAKAAG